MQASWKKHILNFKRPSGTSRGVLTQKETYFIEIFDQTKKGVGECGLLKTLSIDDRPDYEEMLNWTCQNIQLGKDILWQKLIEFPSIQFGVEQAFLSFMSDDPFILFPSNFTKGKSNIEINGLVWMGDKIFMQEQIAAKISEGFSCIKLKIGAIDFRTELSILESIRNHFDASKIEIRVDANGAFDTSDALIKITQLNQFQLHSIEQPIKINQTKEMAILCEKSPMPIALDEELIGVFDFEAKVKLLNAIAPQYIILKPSLIGGIKGTDEWIQLANERNIGWWITSALESNVGLNAIAQYTYLLHSDLPQGLGTGSLYTNNITSPLEIKEGKLSYNADIDWDYNL